MLYGVSSSEFSLSPKYTFFKGEGSCAADGEIASDCRAVGVLGLAGAVYICAAVNAPGIDFGILDCDVSRAAVKLNCISAHAAHCAALDGHGIENTRCSAAAYGVESYCMAALFIFVIYRAFSVVFISVNGKGLVVFADEGAVFNDEFNSGGAVFSARD